MAETRNSLLRMMVGPMWIASHFLAAGGTAQERPDLEGKLTESLAELSRTRAVIADEKIALSARLLEAETHRLEAERVFDALNRRLDQRDAELDDLRTGIQAGDQEAVRLDRVFREYALHWESGLHIGELGRYPEASDAARRAPEIRGIDSPAHFAESVALVDRSIGRLEELVGGARFEGHAAGPDGRVKPGSFVHFGPVAYFADHEGTLAGEVVPRAGSLRPAVGGFTDAAHGALTMTLLRDGEGYVPLDATLGNARKIEATRRTFREHIEKGGVVMLPILAMFATSMLVALIKWVELGRLRLPGQPAVTTFLESVKQGRYADARNAAVSFPGPAGTMLRDGANHLEDPRELVEEVMFEVMLDARFRLQRALPVISICAASAPLLGLLGTVTGIIKTFNLLTVYGSEDMRMLSSGISEALITTEFGLIVAIPSLLFHAYLSRKAKAYTDNMEKLAVSLLRCIEQDCVGGAVPTRSPMSTEEGTSS